MLVTDGPLWVVQRRFVLRHLREFGFGKNDMGKMIEIEAAHLVHDLSARLDAESFARERSNNNNYVRNNGVIYQLADKVKLDEKGMSLGSACLYGTGEKPVDVRERKSMKIEDIYVNAGDYEEVRKASKCKGMIVQMDEVFGVPVLNTMWRMMAGKRYITLIFRG